MMMFVHNGELTYLEKLTGVLMTMTYLIRGRINMGSLFFVEELDTWEL